MEPPGKQVRACGAKQAVEPERLVTVVCSLGIGLKPSVESVSF